MTAGRVGARGNMTFQINAFIDHHNQGDNIPISITGEQAGTDGGTRVGISHLLEHAGGFVGRHAREHLLDGPVPVDAGRVGDAVEGEFDGERVGYCRE